MACDNEIEFLRDAVIADAGRFARADADAIDCGGAFLGGRDQRFDFVGAEFLRASFPAAGTMDDLELAIDATGFHSGDARRPA